MTTALILSPTPGLVPARLFAPTPKAAKRVLEFFTAQINNDHTRKDLVDLGLAFYAGIGSLVARIADKVLAADQFHRGDRPGPRKDCQLPRARAVGSTTLAAVRRLAPDCSQCRTISSACRSRPILPRRMR